MKGCELDSCSFEQVQVVESMEPSNDVLSFRKRRQFDQLRNCKHIEKDAAPCS